MTHHSQYTPYITAITLVAALGGLLFGYDTAVISGAVSSIEANFVAPRGLSGNQANSLTGFAVASALIGCVIGGCIAGALSQRFGRRKSLMAAAAMFLISALGSAWPEALSLYLTTGENALTPFIAYRILGGIGVGVASMLSPLYISEIAPPNMRGRLVSYNQLAIVSGMVVVYFVNWAIASLGDEAWLMAQGWRWMFASECIPASIFFALLFAVPESPRWLVSQGHHTDALNVLERVSPPNEAHNTIEKIKASLHIKSAPLLTYGKLLIGVGLLLSIFQQFVGINVVLYYAPTIFKNMGASTDSALLQTILVGVVNVIFTLIAILTVDKHGRKPLMIIGAVLMSLSMLTLGTLFFTGNTGIAALVTITVYIAAFALSWGPVTWVLLSEIFPNNIRSKAMSIAVAAQWIANWLVSWSFTILDGNETLVNTFHHGFAYWLYGVMGALAAVFVWKVVPETKGKSLEEMETLWGSTSQEKITHSKTNSAMLSS